ncbi:MAG: MBL fold metallo-hydrolase [Clostridia bacterium]
MKLQYLGTAAAEGMPAIFCECALCTQAAKLGGKNIRLRSGALLNDHILIDASPDLYAAKLRLGLNLSPVRNIVITHAHMDHFNRETLAMFTEPYAHIRNRGMLHLWGSHFTAVAWEEYLHGSCIKEPQLAEEIEFHELKPFDLFEVGGVTFTALPAVHSCPDSLIYLCEQNGSKLLYGNDTGLFREDVWQYLLAHNSTPLTAVSLDSTMGLPPSNYNGHMTFEQNVQIRERMLREKLATPSTQFLCHHFSHNGLALHQQAEALMNPKGFEVAYDGLIVTA